MEAINLKFMNILYLTQWFSSIGGGGEVVFVNLAIGMAKRGHIIHVICADTADVHRNKQGNLLIHRVKPELQVPPPSLSKNVEFIVRAILKGHHVIRNHNIEIIHANNLASAVAGSILAKISNKPLVTTIHDVFSTSSHNHWKEWIKQDKKISPLTIIIAPLIEKITAKMPTNIIHTVSNASKDDLIRFGARAPITVIPNGLDPSAYNDVRYTPEYHKNVLYIGRLVFYKNLNTVITSFKDVVGRLPGSKMYIVGEGPMRQKWQRLVSDMGLNGSIEFTGYVSEERKFELLSKCSGVLLPSFIEGFGLVLLESFAMKKPVLVADVKPCNEIVDDGVNGFILPVDSSHKWAEKISFLLNNEDACRKMGSHARDKLDAKYSLDSVLHRIESLYLCLSRKPGPRHKR